MATTTLSKAESRRLYSWWWNSHISPKNSKWLQENLADMDIKIKSMIKLLEEEADSFARRAEMYYKKRPELLKLVEEFYRAYRALAERYDHATRVLHQAQRTMAEAFPNQMPPVLPDELRSGFSSKDQDSRNFEKNSPIQSVLDTDNSEKDAAFTQITLKPFTSGRIRKGLDFQDERKHTENEVYEQFREIQNLNLWEREDVDEEIKRLQEEISQLSKENNELDDKMSLQSRRADKAESEVQVLQDSLSRFISDKEAAILQYQLSVEKISNLEAEISQTREEVKKLNEMRFSEQKKLTSVSEQYLTLEKAKLSLEIALQASEAKKMELTDQLETLNQNLKSSGALVEELKVGNMQLRDLCEKNEIEKVLQREEKFVLENSLSDANAEIETLRENIKNLEASLESLRWQIAVYVSENTTLVSQVEDISEKMKELMETNTLLEVSSNATMLELEIWRGKFKDFEDSFQTLSDQISTLSAEKNALLSQVNSISQNLILLELKHSELQEKYTILERERNSIQLQVIALEEELKVEKQGHDDLLQSSKEQQATLENQINILQEECRRREDLVELEQQRIMKGQIDIFILQGCLRDVEEVNAVLATEHRAYLEKSKGMEEAIASLKGEIERRDAKMSSIEKENAKLRGGIANVLKDLNSTDNFGSLGEVDDEILMGLAQETQKMLGLLSSREDEIQNLALENMISSTLLKQFGLSEAVLKLEKDVLEEELETERAKLLEMSALMNHEIRVRHEREEALCSEIGVVCRQLSDLHESHNSLCCNNSSLLEEHKSLLKNFCEAREMKSSLEEENSFLLSEAAKLDLLLLIFQSINSERASGMKSLYVDKEFLLRIRDDLEQEIRVLHENLGALEIDNSNLNESVKNLETLRDHAAALEVSLQEANSVISRLSEDGIHKENEIVALVQAKDALNHEIKVRNEREEVSCTEMGVLCRQLTDLQEAHHSLCTSNSDLLEEHKSLLKNFCEVREMKISLEEENSFLLSEASKLDFLLLIFQSINSERTSEVNSLGVDMELLLRIRDDLAQEIKVLHEKLGVLEVDNLNMKKSVIDFNAVLSHAAVLEEDLHEANSVISRLSEDGLRKDDEIAALVQAKELLNWEIEKLNKEIKKLENREAFLISELQKCMGEIGFCESEIGELLGELQFTAINGAVLKDKLIELPSAFRALEAGSTVQVEKIKDLYLGGIYLEEPKEEVIDVEGEDGYMAHIVSLQNGISSLEKSLLSLAILHKEYNKKKQGNNEEIVGESRANPEAEMFDFQILHSKVEGLIGLVKVMESHLDKEKLSSGGETDNRDITKQYGSQIFEVQHREVMKDIELDRVSCSSPSAGIADSFKSRTIEIVPSELPAIQSSFQDTYRNPSKRIEEVLFVSGSQEIKHDKGFSVEKKEFSEMAPEHEEEWRNRVLGRLSFDAERLALLQASAEELWRKVAAIENVNHGPPSIEFDILKAQLKEVEGEILKLIRTNNFLMERAASPSQSFRSPGFEETEEARRTSRRGKSVSGEILAFSDSFDNLTIVEEKEVGRGRRRRISMHTRRGSEKVQSLELELEKIDYVLLKFKEKQEYYAAGKAELRRQGRRVSLSDYFYGRRGRSRRPNRVPFCSCVGTKTDSD